MREQILPMIESMASHGTAPEDGCSLFGVGYEDAFRRLKNVYLIKRFNRGASAEKYVVGPFGSGKSHFLHQFMELARENDCVTSKVLLNKDIDFTQTMVVFKELVRGIRIPQSPQVGIRSLIEGVVERIKAKADNPNLGEVLLRGWISGLEQVNFRLEAYGKVLQMACRAYWENDAERLENACRWLSGEMENRQLCKELRQSPVVASERNLQAKRAMYSLFQFIRHAGFQGTVVCYDEAEQGFAVDKKKTERIHSLLMANINSVVELKQGSVFMMYALTPDIIAKMDMFAALQQRLADPAGQGFFDGNTFAPLIDLTKRTDMSVDLQTIGYRLVDLMYDHVGDEMPIDRSAAKQLVSEIAKRILDEDFSSSNRRTLVKEVCTMLLRLYDSAEEVATTQEEEEV